MTKLVRDFRELLTAGERRYAVKAYGEARPDRHWEGWLEFRDDATDEVILTGRETTQPDLLALRHWAATLRPAYLEGAFGRAQRRFGIPLAQRWVV